MLILAVNPGSTSLKAAIFDDEKEVIRTVIRFDTEVLNSFATKAEQNAYRLSAVTEFLKENGTPVEKIDCVVARGAGLKPVKSGAYYINEQMVKDCTSHFGPHGLAISMAYDMMHPQGKPSMIYDAVNVDERPAVAKVTGLRNLRKRVSQHTLNTRRVAIEVAKQMGKPFNEVNLIVAHVGGGISTVAFDKGKLVENFGYHEVGFTPERCGPIELDDMLKMVKTMSDDEIRTLNNGKGGLVSWFGTADIREVQKMIDEGNEEAELVLRAMIYRVTQGIGACAATLKGDVDAIVMTGGAAYSDLLYGWLEEAVKFIAPVKRLPGELELEALAMGALRVLRGEEEGHEYI